MQGSLRYRPAKNHEEKRVVFRGSADRSGRLVGGTNGLVQGGRLARRVVSCSARIRAEIII